MFYGLINSSFWDTFVGVHNSFGVKHFLDLLVNVENFVGFLQVEIPGMRFSLTDELLVLEKMNHAQLGI